MRPMPPDGLGQFTADGPWPDVMAPALDMAGWVMETFIAEDAELSNPDHAHLQHASIGFLWAASGFARQGRTVLGYCEELAFRCNAWQRDRQEQQMRAWFGLVPDFLITLAADYCAQCTDTEFCALVEHELYHIGHAKDDAGAPKFTKEGMPKLAMRAHDVEEFVGVVRRYGPTMDVQALLQAASHPPEVARIDIARACGTCLQKSA